MRWCGSNRRVANAPNGRSKLGARVVNSAIAAFDAAGMRELERVVGALLDATTADVRSARETCRLCDAHACGHYDGICPVSLAAHREQPPA